MVYWKRPVSAMARKEAEEEMHFGLKTFFASM